MDDAEAPRTPRMAEEASGEPESAADPDTRTEQHDLQEAFESPPPRRSDAMSVRQMEESDEDLG